MPNTAPATILDDYGYPTTAALDAIQHWTGTPQALVNDLLAPLFANGGASTEACTGDDGPYEWVTLVTGGWSGCEDTIRTLQTTAFWFHYWSASHRGGLYTFRIPTARWNTPLRILRTRSLALPEEHTVLTALMNAMDCKVDSDTADCPSCGSAPCGPHGTYWYCEAHDWHETDNSDGVCGYALMLTRAATNASRTDDEAPTEQAAVTA